MKLSLQDGEDHTKFASLVECLAKAGKEAFCGCLQVEEGDLRPLCLMVTERGLLGFCVAETCRRSQESSMWLIMIVMSKVMNMKMHRKSMMVFMT